MDIASVAGVVVRPLVRADVPESGRILAQAFHANPSDVALYPRESARSSALPLVYRASTRDAIARGGAYGAFDAASSDRLLGVLLTDPATRPAGAGRLRAVLQAVRTAPAYAGAALLSPERIPAMVSHLRESSTARPAEAHHFVQLVAVDPAAQGRGVGSSLLRNVTARADADGVATYLENVDPRNLPLYERHGFAVRSEHDVALPGGASMHEWTMLRPAGPAPAPTAR